MFSRNWSKIAIVTDEIVNLLYGDEIRARFMSICDQVITIEVPASEKSKSRDKKEEIEDQLFEEKFDRKSLVVALGGGIVGDLAGFVAATFLRGIDFAIIPTTLLAMVDSSIGGKCGINTAFGKNLLGAIYPPCEVLIQLSFLESLPECEIKSGMMEIIKAALVCNKSFFHDICRKSPLEEIIWKARAIKKEMVARDMEEKGERRCLNFGHTVGHAIEKLSDYNLSHGEAIWLGLLVETRISFTRGMLPKDEYDLIVSLLLCKDYAFASNLNFDINAIYSAMKMDKKNKNNKVRMVLLERIGAAARFKGEYATEVYEKEVVDAIKTIYAMVERWVCEV